MSRPMKDSGIAWVNKIPSDWDIHPLYYYFAERNRPNRRGKENNLLSLSYGKIIKKDINTCEGLLPASYNSYNIIDPLDIVLRLTDLQNDKRSLRTGLSHERGIITSAYVTLKPSKRVCPAFFHYLLHAYDVEKVLYNMGNGVRQSLNYAELSKLPLLEPSLQEQQRIAGYLDKKCAEVERLSQNIQKQIEALEQYKRAVITETVTKGLNPSAPMKDSGIPWISSIPQHWIVDKFKYHFIRRELRNRGDATVLSLYRELGVIPKASRDDNHNVTSEDTSKYKYVQKGNFVVNKMKAWQGSVAVSNYDGIVSPAYYVYRFKDSALNKSYFHYLIRSCYKNEFMRLSGGIRVGQWDLPAEALENTLLLIPPKQEQQAIAEYLDKKCARIDGIIQAKQQQLEELEQYKKAIIFEYVTGKKQVPEV